ncbi:MAG: hypothetical protein AB1679_02595 [Actinomycetota bacterium]|jgi:hypothetical protein
MADDEAQPEREAEEQAAAEVLEPLESESRRMPRPRDDTEKAVGLEVARLFGVNPRLLVTRRPKPSDEGEDPTESA